jgi:hypothetical protein
MSNSGAKRLKAYQFLVSDHSDNNVTASNAKFVAIKTIHDVKILFHVHSALLGSLGRTCSQGITF